MEEDAQESTLERLEWLVAARTNDQGAEVILYMEDDGLFSCRIPGGGVGSAPTLEAAIIAAMETAGPVAG